jgi:GntR family transcriptional regulator
MTETAELVLDSGAPIGQQIEGQIRQLVLKGELRAGTELPTVRAMAVGLAVNPRAVEEAYDRLARRGLLNRVDASGPRVSGPHGNFEDFELMQLCRDFLHRAAGRGYSSAALLDALHTCVNEEMSS